ncbi:DUF3857 domain-containing transglutaminase family protein [Wenyingzhuangia sp. chi5]|uniref:DUF3857 domain-containing transglutaminase family protein n=1 Tax=Wenyingzhuangia gilva TaxID=3057677 RepID=A0ABT8VPN2_9FLAO|nr:DUF3857 domain-containing transglutaminase family protein [Wenyingzhuangia sp. chi5]MDO3693939.1 DUF3857 domain-containing transglutaminase family protein [Wenyingzhuangia sp. chi5]
MNLIHKVATLLLCSPILLFGQKKDYSITSIPKDLKENADAIIRLSKYNILIKDEKSMVVSYTKAVTVLNSDGNKHVDYYQTYSDDSKISDISAVEYNAFGVETREYSKKQFQDRSAVSGFYSDTRVKFLDFTPRTYPYTLEFQYEFKTKTTAFIPDWFPIEGYNVSVEKSEFILNNPENFTLLKKEKNIVGSQVQNLSKDGVIHYLLENEKAVKRESYALGLEEVLPGVNIGLTNFSLKGFTASGVNNWSQFGKWLRENLYNSQIELEEATKVEIQNLVKDEPDTLKKAKLVYEYMQNKTRYVFVGIGVGGWQPTPASDVDRLGYGDCKGLSNYTKALLNAVGIESNWVLVYAKNRRDFDKEFIGIQGNHMILNIPKINHGKDVWLECTSQTIPFGFLGDFTDDRDVLVLEKDGGVIKHTPKYKDTNNTQVSNVVVNLDSLGNIKADLNIVSKGIQYSDKYHHETETERDLNKYYKSSRWSYDNNLSLNNYEFVNNKDSLEFTEKLKVDIQKFAPFMGEEMMLRMNVFNMYRRSPKKQKDRKQPFQINTGFVDVDTTLVNLPKNFITDGIPPNKTIKNKFGNYNVSIVKVDEHTLKYTRSFYLKEGRYPKEEYSAYCEFIETIRKHDNLKIVLKREK